MNESFDQVQQLAGEYVIGTLSLVERQAVARRLSAEPVLRSAVEDWEARLLPLTSLAAVQEPSPQLWPRIVSKLRASPATKLVGWRYWWNDLRILRGLAASGFAAAAVFGAMVAMLPPVAEPAFMVILVEPQARTPGWVVQASLDRHITLTPLHPVDVPSQKALQFWTKGEGWSGPVSLGLVKPGKSLKLALDKLPPLQANQLFEITLEPSTGSLTGKPSGPVLYIGKAVKTM